MFSQKYKDVIVNEKFKSMKQLDRIEFQNTLIQQRQILSIIRSGESVMLVCMFVSVLFLANYIYSFNYLYSLGIYSYTHWAAIGNTFLVFSLFAISSIVSLLIRISKMNKYKKQNDEQLDLILNKK